MTRRRTPPGQFGGRYGAPGHRPGSAQVGGPVVDRAGVKRVWWLYAGAGCLLLAAYPLVPEFAQQVSYDAISASVVLALLVGVRRNRPAYRAPWYLFIAGQACYTVADVAYNIVSARYGSVP